MSDCTWWCCHQSHGITKVLSLLLPIENPYLYNMGPLLLAGMYSLGLQTFCSKPFAEKHERNKPRWHTGQNTEDFHVSRWDWASGRQSLLVVEQNFTTQEAKQQGTERQVLLSSPTSWSLSQLPYFLTISLQWMRASSLDLLMWKGKW